MDQERMRRVLAGGLWLDMMAPGSLDRVDWTVFDIASNRRCALGQAFGGLSCLDGFTYALRTYWDPRVDNTGALAALGFLCDSATAEGGPCECDALTAAWLAVWGPAQVRHA